MSSEFERVGNFAVHLAKIARRGRLPHPVVPPALRPLVQGMGERAAAITDASGAVIARRDLPAAQQLLDDDDADDALRGSSSMRPSAVRHRCQRPRSST